MINKKLKWFFLIISLMVIAGCTKESGKEETKQEVQKQSNESEQSFGEDSRLYDFDKKDSITTFYITIPKENKTSFYELNNWYSIHNSDSESPNLDIIIQEGTEKGLKKSGVGYNDDDANATIQLRGKSTRVAPQKSFKIKLNDSTGLWRGQKSLNLNKHPYDATRVRNKLSFDYFTLIPHLTSMRTQFVHLYIKDLDSGPNAKFVDYGLFTQIEQANKRFLGSHGLDPNGNLYKATNFEFFRYADQLKLETDPSFKKKDFESILEIKGSKDHTKLLAMLDDVNNYSLNINEVVKRHFDRENYLTWVATNILMGNQDITTQNFYLYSPVNTDKWYFLPWDYDGAWDSLSKKEQRDPTPDWQVGLSNYWGSVLHKRFFKDPNNVKELSKKIEELTIIINPKQTKEFLDTYYPVIHPFVEKSPDKNYLDINVSDYKDVYYGMTNASEINKRNYYKNLEKPMPFFLDDSVDKKNRRVFSWDASFDIQGDDIFYTFQISTDPGFSNVIHERKRIAQTKVILNQLKAGTYYWRVIAYDTKGNKQTAFDVYEDDDDTKYFGVKKIIVNK